MAKHYFRFAARVLEHLGAELISSDDVAIYELVKNGFDAAIDRESPTTVTVAIEFHVAVQTVAYLQVLLEKEFADKSAIVKRDEVEEHLRNIHSSDEQLSGIEGEKLSLLIQLLPTRGSVKEFQRAIGWINSITVSDPGVGMSADELERYFLTIGTSHRLEEHREQAKSGSEQKGFPVSGEKGIGRLSMMRLGKEAVVRTCKPDANKICVLAIDWRQFIGNGDAQAQDIAVDLVEKPKPENFPSHGTQIEIADLASDWPLTKAEEVGAKFLSKFLDPFRADKRRRVAVTWNGGQVTVPRIGAAFLAAAQNGMKVSVHVDGNNKFSVQANYWFTTDSGVRKTLERTYSSLDFGGVDARSVASVGPFDLELYHYNRRRLAAIPGVATREELKEWLDEWCGGLKLYRDGVRVMPYGQGDSRSSISRTYDDWLELDARALRGRGFRVNRIQVVGCVRISRSENPGLCDQANREGLMDNDASRAFIALLREVVRSFVSELDQQVRPVESDLSELHDAAIRVQDAFEKAVEDLIEAAANDNKSGIAQSRKRLQDALAGVRVVLDDTQQALEDRQLNRIEVLELAATGVAAEAFAHDLEATLDQAIAETSSAASTRQHVGNLEATFTHLRSVFKSLRVQISIIKPGPAKHRRRRGNVEISGLLEQVARFYAGRFERHHISWKFNSRPKDSSLTVFVVEGHLRQVVDNLIRNSIYWLRETREKEPQVGPAMISVTLDTRNRTLQFQDSGIGVAPEDAEWIFGRFNTRRRGGRGLGLYLSKELCEFNGIRLFLDGETRNQWGRLNRFILDFSNCRPMESD